MNNDKIFALSSGAGTAGIAVVRLSGDNLISDFKKIINLKSDITPRRFYMAKILDNSGDLIDSCMAAYFQAPRSFTGEDMIEIYPHGSLAVLDKLFEFLNSCGYRIATPGEFSKRAFYNNKMDLAEVDGLISLLSAKTDKQRQYALKSMLGADSSVYENWRKQMIELSAYAAAILDYASDELPNDIQNKVINNTKKLQTEISGALNRYEINRGLISGFNVVLSGEVNVGKSSLFNAIVGTSRAIVSDIPGTTRDVIDTEINIGGYLIKLLDTAGIRESDDEIEKIGIDKSYASLDTADLILRVYANEIRDIEPPKPNEIVVFNKSDIRQIKSYSENSICVSAMTGHNIDKLIDMIKSKIDDLTSSSENNLIVSARSHKLLIDTNNELIDAVKNSDTFDLMADNLKSAADNIGKILGVINPDEVADATFNLLCLGK